MSEPSAGHDDGQAQTRAEILIVDDSRVIRRAAVKMLGDDYVVHEAADGEDGWNLLQQNPAISVVFTDLQMPRMNGLQLLDAIRDSDDEHIRQLAVIMVTGRDDGEEAKREAFEHGATDFIGKPFDSMDLVSRARSYARLVLQVEALEKHSGVDRLTGLLRVESFEAQGEKALSFARRHQLDISLVQLEIADFQQLYLQHGKAVAQQIIVAIAEKLQHNLRAEDFAARTGVAKYAMLLPLCNQQTAHHAVARLQQLIDKLVFDTGTEKIRIALLAGISSPDIGAAVQFSEMMEQADRALQSAHNRDDRVAGFEMPADENAAPLDETALKRCVEYILRGEFQRIPREQLQPLLQRMRDFMAFAESADKQR